MENESIETILKEKLEEEIDTPLINKNISNWLSGKHAPDKKAFDSIVKLEEYCHRFDKIHIKQLLIVAKIIDYFYKKSDEYFGKNITETLIESMRLQSIIMYKECNNQDTQVNTSKAEQLLEHLTDHYMNHSIYDILYFYSNKTAHQNIAPHPKR